TVMPGSTKTEGVAKLVQEIFPGMSLEEAEKRFMRENRPSSLIERLIHPKEIADFVTYLSSPLASAINGAALRIDGGLVRCVFCIESPSSNCCAPLRYSDCGGSVRGRGSHQMRSELL